MYLILVYDLLHFASYYSYSYYFKSKRKIADRVTNR